MGALRLPATLDSLTGFCEYARRQVADQNLDESIAARLELVLEELLTNVMKYAYIDNAGEIELSFSFETQSITMIITDWGEPFNPLQKGEPDLSDNIHERQVGGLGIHLVRNMVDQLDYARCDDSNILTVTMKHQHAT